MSDDGEIDKLIAKLYGEMELRSAARDILWKYPEPWHEARRAEAQKRIEDQEARIIKLMTKFVRTHDDSA